MSKGKNLVLIGIMGCGKSSVASCLQDKMPNFHWVDTDTEIEKLENKSIPEIFADSGEDYFRYLESWVIEKFANIPNLIISTGGGSFENEDNINNLKKNSTIFYLTAEVDTLCKRLESNTTRPLLENEDISERLTELLEKRQGNYKKADYSIATDYYTPPQVAEEIFRLYES